MQLLAPVLSVLHSSCGRLRRRRTASSSSCRLVCVGRKVGGWVPGGWVELLAAGAESQSSPFELWAFEEEADGFEFFL